MRQLAILVVDILFRLLGKAMYLTFYILGWRFICTIGRIAGDVIYRSNREMREITEEELNLLFGSRFAKERIRDITKRSFENYYMRLIEMILFGALNKDRINEIVHAEGLENLDMALSEGKGVILLLSHFGSFLLPLPFLGHREYKVNQVTGKQIHTSLIAERIWKWRKKEADKLPINFIQADKFLRPVYKALMKNEIVAMAFDGRDGSKWAVTEFFERKVRFSMGPFELARKTGATIIPTFTIRRKNGSHKLVLESPFKLTNINQIESALLYDTRRFAELFTRYIEESPCHFGMVPYRLKSMSEMGGDNPFFVGSK